jgi:hypothetical protein
MYFYILPYSNHPSLSVLLHWCLPFCCLQPWEGEKKLPILINLVNAFWHC